MRATTTILLAGFTGMLLAGCGKSADDGPTPIPFSVTGAFATGPTAVRVELSREVNAGTVDAADFAIAGLTVLAAAPSGATVTLTTSAQLEGGSYTVVASGLSDASGNGLTGGASAPFTGFTPTTPAIAVVSPTTLVRGSAAIIDGARLAGATVTIGGGPQTVDANTSAQIRVSVVAASTPVGSQPVVVTTANGASAPYDTTVLDQLRLVAATATGTTEVVLTFSRAVDATSVSAADFDIPGLTVVAATSALETVTLTTLAQTPDQSYTVSVASEVLDDLGTPASGDPAMFTGFHP